MLESKEQFYLYDRWFYLLKETDDKIEYTSGVKDSLTGIVIEYCKDTKDVNILYFEDRILLAKLAITDIGSKKVKFHYQDQEPQQIIINDHTYVNLLIEFFTTVENEKLGKKKVKINKKKKMNKICYNEPTFPINKEMDLKNINIESDVFSYYLGLIGYIKTDLSKIEKCINYEIVVDDIEKPLIRDLNVPQEIEFYDRTYKLNKMENNTIYYENKQFGVYNLEIKLDNNMLHSISLNIKEHEDSKKGKSSIKFISNELGGVTVKFSNHKKSTMMITTSEIKTYDSVKFKSVTVFDKDENKVMNNIELDIEDEEKYNLAHHPYRKLIYVDEMGNEYRLASADFSRLDALSDYGPGIFNNIKKILCKK